MRRLGTVTALAMILTLAGCVTAPAPSVPDVAEPAQPVIPPPPRNLVIVQSDASPAFAGVTRAIAAKWKDGGATIYSVDAHADADLTRRLQQHEGAVVIAVGLGAALAVRKLRNTRAIFCQVFNYDDYDLLTPWRKGVSAMPPIVQQFRVWKKLDPQLKRVGVITGPRLQHLVAEARQAAAASGIELHHAEVGSDLETMYAYKKLSPTVQALWLLPDNRVLSVKAIRDLLSTSRKQGKQVVVFSDQLLALGGLMNYDSVAGDIADQVIARSAQAFESGSVQLPGPAIVPLTQLAFKINQLAVKQLGLTIPPELKGNTYVP
jgi:ABC-type uncharacterized transport system substrate-binding protein